jgi:hydroxyacylglutathione hydrolase
MTDLRLFALPALSDNYIWLLADAAGAALVVDPGEAAPVRAALESEGLRLRAILLTHHHGDHVAGADELAREWKAAVWSPVDRRIRSDHPVAGGERVEPGEPEVSFEVIEVPGHTRTHVAYHGHGLLFCGDTLFSVGCGRLFEGTPAQMLASLERLAALPADTRVCCGHEYTLANCAFARTLDPDNAALATRTRSAAAAREAGLPTLPSVLADERACNPFLRVDSEALVAALGHPRDRVGRFAELRRRKDEYRSPAA